MKNDSIVSLLNSEEVSFFIKIFKKNSAEIKLVGGCVRDTILGKKIKDIDFAANIEPDQTIKILKYNNIKYDDYAKKYGSILAFKNNNKFEITSLRKDINQKGRDTDVIYTKDWEADAKRRDFTVNAIYLNADKKIIDFFGGINDLKNNKIKFIGDIDKRINEDYIRIFRYYRFLGIFENPNEIEKYDEIILKHLPNAFLKLSNEVIRSEILKMFNNFFPKNSFFINHEKKLIRSWLEMTKKHFVLTNYELGLKKCLNKINLLDN